MTTPILTGKYENDLRQIGLGLTQKFSDRLQTRVDINDQNILRHGSKYELKHNVDH